MKDIINYFKLPEGVLIRMTPNHCKEGLNPKEDFITVVDDGRMVAKKAGEEGFYPITRDVDVYVEVEFIVTELHVESDYSLELDDVGKVVKKTLIMLWNKGINIGNFRLREHVKSVECIKEVKK